MVSGRQTLSLCMIVKDEENFLARCLDSVKDFVDEMVIVDTGSKDKTKEIAGQYTDKVYDFVWCDDFSKARNFSLSKATKDWVLVLDADEYIDKKSMQKVAELVQDRSVDAYQITQINYSMSDKGSKISENDTLSGQYKSFFLSVLIRLFRNKGYMFANRIHELIEDSVKQAKGNIVKSGISIHHLSDTSKDKDSLYLGLCEKQIADSPDSPKPYYEAAKVCSSKKDYAKAIHFFSKAVALLGDTRGLLIHQLVYADLGEAYFRVGDYAHADVCFDQAITHDPSNPLPYFYKGMIAHEEGDITGAKVMYEKSVSLGILSPVAYANLGDIELKKKQYKEAYGLLQKAYLLGHPKKDAIKIILDKLKGVV